MTYSKDIQEHETRYHGIQPPPTPEPEPGANASGIPIYAVKPGWTRAGATDFAEDIALGSWTGDKQGVLDGRASGDDTSRRGKYSNVKCMSQHDSVLDCRMFQDTAGQRWMGCPKNKAGDVNDQGALNLRVTECMKIDGPEAGWKIAHMVAKYGAVRSQEFDYPEAQLDADGNGSAFVHAMGNDKRYPFPNGTLYGWHVYTMERVANQYVQFELDGQFLGRWADGVNADRVHWIIQNETSIGGTLPARMGEAHVLLDWVTVDVR